MEDEIGKRFSLFCDLDGKVTQILQNENQTLSPSLIGNLLFSIVVQGDLDKMINFFLELKTKNTAIGWEINIKTQSEPETFSFFGGVFNNQIGIAAATTKSKAQLLFTDFAKINNEQANLIRTLSKEKEQLKIQVEEMPVSYYEELSSLNNELVNMQRELSKKNRQLDELNKIKNQFLGIAAHDLRNPIAVIMGYSEFLLEEAQENKAEDQLSMLHSIINSSKFMLHLLNDLLDVSAIESGNLNLNLVKTNLVALVEKNVELNNVIAHKKNIDINLYTAEQIPEVIIDAGKIEQILNNLISNAVKFSKFDTEVMVKITKNDNEIIIAVADQGPGIPESEIENLFKPFKKTSVTSTAGEKSTGLGLSIVQKLVQGHKGNIWVKSTVGKGSTFYFSLPI